MLILAVAQQDVKYVLTVFAELWAFASIGKSLV